MPERCGARLRNKGGIRCRQWPVKGKRRCRLHGGHALRGRRMPYEWYIEHTRYMTRRRLEHQARRRELKRAGLTWCISYSGKRWAHMANRTHMRQNEIKAARNLVMEQIKNLPAASTKPWDQQDDGEKLRTLTGKALEQKRRLFDMPIAVDDEGKPATMLDVKLLALQEAGSTAILGMQIKVDEGALRETKPDMIAEVIRRIHEVKTTITGDPIPVPLRGAPVIEHAAAWPPRHQKRKPPKGVPATEWGHMKHEEK